MIPVSLRELPKIGSKASKLSNEIIGSFVKMPLFTNEEIDKRLDKVKNILTEEIKKSLLVFITKFAMKFN